jgi:hypothetical protein
MAGITLAQAEQHLAQWLAADTALAQGKSYSIGGRSLDRSETMDQIKFWQARVTELSTSANGGKKMVMVVPRDL